MAIDAAAVVLLREAPALVEELKDEPLVDPPLWTPAALLAGLPDLSHDTVDVLVLFVVRVLVLFLLAGGEGRHARPEQAHRRAGVRRGRALLINAADAAAGGRSACRAGSAAAAAAADVAGAAVDGDQAGAPEVVGAEEGGGVEEER